MAGTVLQQALAKLLPSLDYASMLSVEAWNRYDGATGVGIAVMRRKHCKAVLSIASNSTGGPKNPVVRVKTYDYVSGKGENYACNGGVRTRQFYTRQT